MKIEYTAKVLAGRDQMRSGNFCVVYLAVEICKIETERGKYVADI